MDGKMYPLSCYHLAPHDADVTVADDGRRWTRCGLCQEDVIVLVPATFIPGPMARYEHGA